MGNLLGKGSTLQDFNDVWDLKLQKAGKDMRQTEFLPFNHSLSNGRLRPSHWLILLALLIQINGSKHTEKVERNQQLRLSLIWWERDRWIHLD